MGGRGRLTCPLMRAVTPEFRVVGKQWWLLLALLVPATGWAQMQCTVEATPTVARMESATELLPDLVLRCTGGTPAPSVDKTPRYQILVTTGATLTSRPVELLTPADTPWIEALLLVDDPPETAQRPCVPLVGDTSCPLPEAGGLLYNVFQAETLQENIAAFDAVPINPPGENGTRTLRITNLRVDMAALYLADDPTQTGATVLIFSEDGTRIPVTQFADPLLTAQPAVTFSVETYLGAAVGATEPALRLAPSQVPRVSQPLPGQLPNELDPLLAHTFHVKFTEVLPGAFKRRSIGASSRDPSFVSNQSIPGAGYQTESGFFNTNFGIKNDLDTAGVADSATRLMVVFEDVPAGVDVYVSVRDVNPGTTGFAADAPRALFTLSGFTGSGPYAPPQDDNYVRLSPVPNVGVAAVWEVVAADPSQIEELSFTVALASPAQAPSLGKARAYGFLAPVGEVYPDLLAGLPIDPEEKPLLYLNALRDATEKAVPRFAILEKPLPLAAFELTNVITTPRFSVVSAASYGGTRIARGSIAAGFGTALANTTLSTGNALGTSLLGTSVEIVDSTGRSRMAPLFLVGPNQINFYVDPDTALGPAVANVINSSVVISSGQFVVDRVAPALFTANGTGSGPPAGQLLRVQIGFRFVEPLVSANQDTGAWDPRPLSFGPEDELLILFLYGTGFRGRSSLEAVTATIDGIPIDVTFAGAQPDYLGLDQLNLGPLPRQLSGRGQVILTLSVDGQAANSVVLDFAPSP